MLVSVMGSTARAATPVPSPKPQASSRAVGSGLPVMGYNTWYQFRTNADEADLLAEAQELVSSGLAASGYDTVNLDDGWMLPARNSAGDLVADPAKFPDGMLSISNQLHAMGLKLGIYESIGTRTCQNFPGSFGHYAADAALFASWQVDYVKIDACGGTNPSTEPDLAADFNQYGGFLKSDNPNVLYSQELPVPFIGTSSFTPAMQASSASQANTWRVSPDEFGSIIPVLQRNLTADIHLHGYAGSGHWNDLDMVVPPSIFPAPSSASYLMYEETQLGGWAVEASPLLVSTDLSILSDAELNALKNPDMLAIDHSGAQSSLVVTVGHVQAFVKPADGGTVIYLSNTGTGTASASFTLKQLGITAAKVSGRNVWTGGTATWGGISVTIPAGGSSLLVAQ